MHRRAEIAVFLRAEKAGNDDGAADVAAEGERDENERHLVAVADGGQGAFADQFARDQAVRNIIKLLEDHAPEERKAEPP